MVGRLAEASAIADRVLGESRLNQERGNEAWAMRLHGQVAARADPVDTRKADTYYREALALAEELGMRPLVAHCHLGLGTLYQKVGRHESAQAELITAAQMYRAMEMTFWLAKAEAAMALTGAG
jgi:sugar phosphate isomerase/epimerase